MTTPKEPRWLGAKAILALHDTQLHTHGGLAGVRDMGLLESASGKANMAWGLEDPQPDFYHLAALYVVGIARNHPFNDANKRTAWVAGQAFLYLNGIEIIFNPIEAVLLMVRVAEGSVDVAELAAWLRKGGKA